MRAVLEYRASITLALAGVVGTVGLRTWPFPADNVFLAVLETRKPWLFDGLEYLYATLWFSTPFVALGYSRPSGSHGWRVSRTARKTLSSRRANRGCLTAWNTCTRHSGSARRLSRSRSSVRW